MDWLDIVWTDWIDDHIRQHGLTREDVRNVIWYPTEADRSDSSGRPIRFGTALDGRPVMVVYELVDDITIYPITAYEVNQ